MAFESAILTFESAITLVFESAITLAAESAIILGESIFWKWRSFFVMMRGDHFGRVDFSGIAIIFCGDEIWKGDLCLGGEVRSLWESAIILDFECDHLS